MVIEFTGQWRRHWSRHFLIYCLPLIFLLGKPGSVIAQDALTLNGAIERALAHHPDLQIFQARFKGLEATRESAELRPAYALDVELENVAGSGEFSGTDSAELTVSLSSAIELGGKRHSRIAAADSRYALANAEREAAALDLLGLVTQGFIATLSLQEQLKVAQSAVELAERTYRLVDTRVQRGAAPEAERLRAQAAVKQATLHQQALAAELASRKFALASLWKGEPTEFGEVRGELFQFADSAGFDELYQRVAASPALQVFASEERLRDAEVALARSQSAANVQWSLGVRRFEESGDSALTAGLSIPLFSGRRNRGELQSALAERESIQYRREAALLAVRARLFEAWQTYRQSAAAARQMRADVLPALEKALEQTRKAYEHGRYSYVDWVSAQRELLDARLAAIDAATTALANQALIEQLTAEPLGSAAVAPRP